uniref:Regulator of G-protein signaling 1 n=1 Tax=Xiphophorus maculatus TaxID=8083 RepID=A0A3B5QLY6_XIPMA
MALDALFKGRFCCFPKDPLDDVEVWSESVDKVLGCKAGQIAFREFLKSEYSEENILFWLACEDYKKIKTVPEMISSANRIYSEFVHPEAPRQVTTQKHVGLSRFHSEPRRSKDTLGCIVRFQINIDCTTRENITKNISQPTLTSFDTAQKLVYSLMARDCYPRFLKSDIYQGLLRKANSR